MQPYCSYPCTDIYGLKKLAFKSILSHKALWLTLDKPLLGLAPDTGGFLPAEEDFFSSCPPSLPSASQNGSQNAPVNRECHQYRGNWGCSKRGTQESHTLRTEEFSWIPAPISQSNLLHSVVMVVDEGRLEQTMHECLERFLKRQNRHLSFSKTID